MWHLCHTLPQRLRDHLRRGGRRIDCKRRKQCFLGTTGSLHTWIHSVCGSIRWPTLVKPGKIPAWRRQVIKGGWEERVSVVSFLYGFVLVGLMHSSGWPHSPENIYITLMGLNPFFDFKKEKMSKNTKFYGYRMWGSSKRWGRWMNSFKMQCMEYTRKLIKHF